MKYSSGSNTSLLLEGSKVVSLFICGMSSFVQLYVVEGVFFFLFGVGSFSGFDGISHSTSDSDSSLSKKIIVDVDM